MLYQLQRAIEIQKTELDKVLNLQIQKKTGNCRNCSEEYRIVLDYRAPFISLPLFLVRVARILRFLHFLRIEKFTSFP